MQKDSKDSYPLRMRKLLDSIPDDTIYYIEDPIDLFYLTGLKLSKGTLIIAQQPTLCVDGRYTAAAKQAGCFSVAGIDEEESVLKNCNRKVLCFDSDKTSFNQYQALINHAKHLSLDLRAIKHPLQNLRMIKSLDEIERMEASARINQQALEYAASFLKEGVTEQEIAKHFICKALDLGAEKVAFDPIVAFGENTALPHHRASSAALKKQDPVLLDVGVMYQGYASDITRTCFYDGALETLRCLREQVIALQRTLVAKVKPGVSTYLLASIAKEQIESLGHTMLHSLGHGLGLEVHEFPRLAAKQNQDQILQPGMVITIEPGIYIEGLGGFREEDTLLITETGYKNFYKNFEFATVKI